MCDLCDDSGVFAIEVPIGAWNGEVRVQEHRVPCPACQMDEAPDQRSDAA